MFQDIDPDILEAVNIVENEYQEFFKGKLKEYGIKSPNELSYEEAQKFFNDIEKNWKGVNEEENKENDAEEINEGIEDVYAATYNQLINPGTLGVGDVVSFPYSGYNTDFKIELIVNPSCFGMPSIYHLKALNGPLEGGEYAFNESFVYNAIHENKEINVKDDNLERVVEALENNEIFEAKKCKVKEEINNFESEESEELKLEESKNQLKESVDFDVTKENDKTLEELLKVFLKNKALDGEDYEIISKGNKLILKVYNKKYVEEIKKLLKGE